MLATIPVTGAKAADWQEWWSALPADWAPPSRPQKMEIDLSVSPGVFSDGKVTCFGIATRSRALVYCVEAARPEPWESMRDEVIRSVETLPDGAKFGIVVYGAEAKPWRKRLANADAGTRANAVGGLVCKPHARLLQGVSHLRACCHKIDRVVNRIVYSGLNQRAAASCLSASQLHPAVHFCFAARDQFRISAAGRPEHAPLAQWLMYRRHHLPRCPLCTSHGLRGCLGVSLRIKQQAECGITSLI